MVATLYTATVPNTTWSQLCIDNITISYMFLPLFQPAPQHKVTCSQYAQHYVHAPIFTPSCFIQNLLYTLDYYWCIIKNLHVAPKSAEIHVNYIFCRISPNYITYTPLTAGRRIPTSSLCSRSFMLLKRWLVWPCSRFFYNVGVTTDATIIYIHTC